MTKELSEWFEVDGDNDFASAEGGMAEGMNRSAVNNSGRARMGAHTRWAQPYNMAGDNGLGNMEWLDILRHTADRTPLTLVRTDATHIRVTVGTEGHEKYFKNELAAAAGKRRIRVTDSRTSPTVVTDMFVTDYTYSNPYLDLTVDTTLPATVGAVYLHSMQSLDFFAFRSTIPGFYVTPTDFTEAAFDVALATLDSAGGGVLLLDTGTYEITETKSMTVPIIILGRGMHATTIKAADAAGLIDYMMRTIGPGDGGGLQDLTFDGNRANNGTTATGENFIVSTRVIDYRINGVRFIGAGEDGLSIRNAGGAADSDKTTRIYVDNCTFSDCGRHGVYIEDQYTTDVSFYLSNLDISLIGQTDNAGAGIKAAGQLYINNVAVTGLNRGTPSVQRGIWLVEPTGTVDLQDARHSTLSNFHVDGTGQDVVGVQIGGHEIAVSNGVLTLSGPAAFGIIVSDDGIAAPHAIAIDNVVVDDAWVGIQLQPDSHECSVSNTHMKSCFNGIEVQGDQHTIRGVTVDSSSNFGVSIDSTAVGTQIHGAHIYAGTTTGINVISGALDTVITDVVVRAATSKGMSIAGDDTVVQDCTIFDISGGTGIDVLAAAQDVKIANVRMHNVGTEVADAGTHTIVDDVDGIDWRLVTEDTSTDSISGGWGFPGVFHNISYPGLGPNGFRKYRFVWNYEIGGGPGTGKTRLMSGAGDDPINDNVITNNPNGFAYNILDTTAETIWASGTAHGIAYDEYTPAASEVVGIATDYDSGSLSFLYQALVIEYIRGT